MADAVICSCIVNWLLECSLLLPELRLSWLVTPDTLSLIVGLLLLTPAWRLSVLFESFRCTLTIFFGLIIAVALMFKFKFKPSAF